MSTVLCRSECVMCEGNNAINNHTIQILAFKKYFFKYYLFDVSLVPAVSYSFCNKTYRRCCYCCPHVQRLTLQMGAWAWGVGGLECGRPPLAQADANTFVASQFLFYKQENL